jgi:Protein of unknown function (DUF3293)
VPMNREKIRRGKPTLSARTLTAYRKTTYEAAGIEIRIGRRSPAMDRLLASHGVRQAVFITAYNPFSRVMPPGWNHRMQARLAQGLRRRRVLPANGSWRRWSEAHLIVFGDVRPVCRLTGPFRQNAIVIVGRGQPAQLRLAPRLL